MIINYNEFPLLSLSPCAFEITPNHRAFDISLKLDCPDLQGISHFHKILESLKPLDPYNKKPKHNNYYLTKELSDRLRSTGEFTNNDFSFLSKVHIGTFSGILLLDNAVQIPFVLLSSYHTNLLRNIEGRYFSTALFVKEDFMGMKEAIIKPDHVHIESTNTALNSTEHIEFLSFVLYFLHYLQRYGKCRLINRKYNDTVERIYWVGEVG